MISIHQNSIDVVLSVTRVQDDMDINSKVSNSASLVRKRPSIIHSLSRLMDEIKKSAHTKKHAKNIHYFMSLKILNTKNILSTSKAMVNHSNSINLYIGQH